MTTTHHPAQWLYDSAWGLMVEFLAAPASTYYQNLTSDEWQRRVDNYALDRVVQQIVESQARYIIFTIGQSSGHYCSPNATYDAIVGRNPSLLSRRDLVKEMADALAKHDIKTLAYVVSHAPTGDVEACRALRCLPPWQENQWRVPEAAYGGQPPLDARLTEFQLHWEAVVREWSLRWGDSISGWWVDSCQPAPMLYDHPDGPNWNSLAAALRAGNPKSILAFNPGVTWPVLPFSPVEDYSAGEANNLIVGCAPCPVGRFVGTAQYQVLTYLGEYWGRGNPRFQTPLVVEYTREVLRVGGSMTWDVPYHEDGTLMEPHFKQLLALGKEFPRGPRESLPLT